MSPLFSDGNSESGFASMSSTLRASSSQSSRASMETPFDSFGTDPLQHSLGSSWASYLSAQHSSRELGALKRSVNEQIDSIKASTSSLQQEASRNQSLMATALSEFRAQSERAASELNRLKPLQDSLPALRQELRSHSGQSSKSLGELSDKFSVLHERLDGMDSLVSRDMKTVQDRYGTALKMIEFLQGELKGLTAEKIALEEKLSTVERKVETMTETSRPLPDATIDFLTSIFSRREDLLKLLDKPDGLVMDPPPVQSEPERPLLPRLTRAATKSLENARMPEKDNPKVIRKRKGQDPPPASTSAKRGSSSKQNLGALLSRYKQDYKANPPRSDVLFIWSFLGDIEDAGMSKHIQEELATNIPKFVTLKRGLRNNKGSHRHINIRPGLAWKEFQKAVLKTPPPPE